MIPFKGPQGKDKLSHSKFTPPEPQEEYEEKGCSETEGMPPHNDGVIIHQTNGLKADSGDHTPDNYFITRSGEKEKPNYGKSNGKGNGGIGL